MNFHRREPTHKIRASRGAFVILVVICAAVLLMVIGLVVDTLRLIVTVRQLQEAADGAAFSAANVLAPNSADSNEIERKIRVSKETARGAVLRASISGASASSTRYFRYGSQTAMDPDIFDPSTQQTYEASETIEDENLIMRVERGIWCLETKATACFNPDPRKREGLNRFRFISVERPPSGCGNFGPALNPNQFYCLINAVEVTLTIPRFNTTFMRVAGVERLNSITRSAVATSRIYGTACGVPTCEFIRSETCAAPPSGDYYP